MHRTKTVGRAVAAVVAMAICTAGPALAATPSPGVLRAADLPGSFVVSHTQSTYQGQSDLLVNRKKCTETPEPIAKSVASTTLGFARATAPQTTEVTELVTWFDAASSAMTAFKLYAKSWDAAVKCRTVRFVPPNGGPAAGEAISWTRVKFPKIGSGSKAARTTTKSAPIGALSIMFVSGPYLASLVVAGTPDALSLKDMMSVARRAEQRLRTP